MNKESFSIAANQQLALISISRLYLKQRIHLDLCYNRGGFYSVKKYPVALPEIRNDINSEFFYSGFTNSVWDCRQTLLRNSSIRSIMFDPPFLIGSNKMTDRYGGFAFADDMFEFQSDSVREISRILMPGGWLVTKIQDFTKGGQKYFPSICQVNSCRENNLDLIDSFIVMNKSRMRGATAGEKSSISIHCFFHVFQKVTRKKRIIRY